MILTQGSVVAGPSGILAISRRELYNIFTSSGQSKIDNQFNFLTNTLQLRTGCPQSDLNDIKTKMYHFKSEFKTKWLSVGRSEKRFLDKYNKWLDTIISFKRYEPCNQSKRGRPTIPFVESNERTKRKKTEELRKSTPIAELSYATQMGFRATGNTEASKLLKEITTSSPQRASKYKKAYKTSLQKEPCKMSGEDALALLVDAKLSRHQYSIIRQSNPDRFPSYKVLQAEKKKCYPNDIKVNETSAQVPLQALLNHTVERLITVQENVLSLLSNEELGKLQLMTKWGFDGSSGHSSYKQAFHGSQASDSAVFITSIVPLRLVCDPDGRNQKIVWQNPRPSSTRYCRPLKIAFMKESSEVSVAEKNRVDTEIQQLQNSELNFHGRFISVSHKMIFAMIDGKICNALTKTTSTQKCYICGATSKDFNDIDTMITRPISTQNLQFGISVLHGWIRFFECLLHISYKLPIQKWQARGDEKLIVAETKKYIQTKFREKTGLLVDFPKPGFGNSNDGNTSRRFFSNPEISAEITKLDVELIKKMHNILIVVSCGHSINLDRFREYTRDTARHFVNLYGWYRMPPTLHKFFIHGADIISSALLPIGQLTEEAQEARNKDFKNYREQYSRKCNREKSNEDIFNLFLLTSDPILTSKRKESKKSIKKIPKEALDMLVPPTVTESQSNEDEEDEDSLHSDSDDYE